MAESDSRVLCRARVAAARGTGSSQIKNEFPIPQSSLPRTGLRRLRHDRILVVIPVHGEHEFTHAVLTDLWTQQHPLDITIVDNRGDYPSVGDETVIRPRANLGWAAGTNRGTAETLAPHHAAVVWMNNDTRLTRGFMGGLERCWRKSGAGLIAPSYDCYWNHQRLPRVVDVSQYRPRRQHYSVPFVDGTCMFVPVSTLDTIGMLDEETFAPVGYGADIDYGLRVRARGMSVVVTRLAYLHHEKSATAKEVFAGGLEEYGARGYPVMDTGMRAKWGEDWRRLAGIDLDTGQTKRPTLQSWAVTATASVSRRLSASRRHSRL